MLVDVYVSSLSLLCTLISYCQLYANFVHVIFPESFRKYFSSFGEITDCVIMMDKVSGRPRGFGFVTFADPEAANKVLEEDHVIDGRTVGFMRGSILYCHVLFGLLSSFMEVYAFSKYNTICVSGGSEEDST